MIKKLIALLSALMMCSIICPSCYAEEDAAIVSENENSTYDNTSVRLLDLPDLITNEEEDEILTAASSFAKRSGLNIGIVIANDIGEDKSDENAVRFSEEMYIYFYGEDTDGLLLVMNEDTNFDNIYRSGSCKELYSTASMLDTFTAIYDEWDDKDYKSALLSFVEKIEYHYDTDASENEAVSGMDPEDIPQGPIGEDIPGKPVVKILDDYNYLTPSEEKEIISAARSFSDRSNFNIIFVLTDEIGSDKSDRGTMNYADDRYDELCGINTDGILLLINNDTKYDWISTSGSCINYYSDNRINRIFDRIYDDIVAGDYCSACLGFVDKCEYYYDQGKANNQVGFESGDGYIELDFMMYAEPLVVMLIIVAIAAAIAYNVITSPYKLKKAQTTNYTVPGSLLLSINTTASKGIITTRTYSPRSSGGGGRSGGRSSTHRSSSGGRHGGGGRRR